MRAAFSLEAPSFRSSSYSSRFLRLPDPRRFGMVSSLVLGTLVFLDGTSTGHPAEGVDTSSRRRYSRISGGMNRLAPAIAARQPPPPLHRGSAILVSVPPEASGWRQPRESRRQKENPP